LKIHCITHGAYHLYQLSAWRKKNTLVNYFNSVRFTRVSIQLQII